MQQKKKTNIEIKEEELKILSDSSWFIAVLDENDSHHQAAKSSLGALEPYNPVFYVAPIVYLEIISRLIKKGKTVRKAYDIIEKFLKDYGCKHKNQLDRREISEKYKMFSRIQKIKDLTPVDFYIASEGILLNARILTCDIDMYNKTKKHYKNIYFMTDKSKKEKSDLGQLMNDIQGN